MLKIITLPAFHSTPSVTY